MKQIVLLLCTVLFIEKASAMIKEYQASYQASYNEYEETDFYCTQICVKSYSLVKKISKSDKKEIWYYYFNGDNPSFLDKHPFAVEKMFKKYLDEDFLKNVMQKYEKQLKE